jgi:hypothetical protein
VGPRFVVARGPGPAHPGHGGAYALDAYRYRSPRHTVTCVELVRLVRLFHHKRAQSFPFVCTSWVPQRRAMRADAGFNCFTSELVVAGLVSPAVSRVLVRMYDGRTFTVRPVAAPAALGFEGRLFSLIRADVPDSPMTHPDEIRAVDEQGRTLDVQPFEQEAGSSIGCFGPPPRPPIGRG